MGGRGREEEHVRKRGSEGERVGGEGGREEDR